MKRSMLITCSMLILPIFCFAEDAEAPKEPVIPRIVPVDPLLSQVNAKTGYMRFWANVPTNGCKIVATVDGKPLGPMSVGKHKVVVKLVEDATGKVKVENTYPIIAVSPKPVISVRGQTNVAVTGEGAIKGCGGAQTIVVEDSSDVLVEGLRLIDAPAKSCVFRNDNILKVRLIRTVGATDPADNFTIERCTVAEFLGCTAAVCDVK